MGLTGTYPELNDCLLSVFQVECMLARPSYLLVGPTKITEMVCDTSAIEIVHQTSGEDLLWPHFRCQQKADLQVRRSAGDAMAL